MRPHNMPEEAYRMVRLEAPEANGHEPLTANRTDLGNATRLAERHGADLRYVYSWDKWHVWDGRRWKVDDSGEVARRAKETVRAMYHEADPGGGKPIDRDLANHALKSEARGRLESMISLARSEQGIALTPEQLDANRWLLNVENGTVDLRTGERRAHRREDLISKMAGAEYHPDAAAPTWEAFLERILPSESLRRFVQTVVGYAAAGAVSEEILVILHGVGANGKSTLVNAVMAALGDYAQQAAPDLLLAKRGSHPTELADLFGARFVASVEVDENRRLAEGLVKQLTGRDPIRARRMREDFWQFDPTHTVFLATNHRPEVRGTDLAIWRRIRLVPFDVTIPKDEQDKRLPEKLRAELPGILRWVVEGCLLWQREGLGEPSEVQAATGQYREDMDVLAAFIADRCVVNPRASAGATPLYNAYTEWCEENGENRETQTKFGLRLRERGFVREKAQKVTWRGIGLRADDPGPDPTSGPEERAGGGDPPPNRRTIDGSESNRLTEESRKDKGITPDEPSGFRQSRPKTDINETNAAREEVIAKKGLQPSNRLQPSSAPGHGLTVEEVAAELRRAGSGPARALAHYLAEPESRQRLEYLARAVLEARGADTGAWEDVAAVVVTTAGDPNNHPLDCGCEACL